MSYKISKLSNFAILQVIMNHLIKYLEGSFKWDDDFVYSEWSELRKPIIWHLLEPSVLTCLCWSTGTGSSTSFTWCSCPTLLHVMYCMTMFIFLYSWIRGLLLGWPVTSNVAKFRKNKQGLSCIKLRLSLASWHTLAC